MTGKQCLFELYSVCLVADIFDLDRLRFDCEAHRCDCWLSGCESVNQRVHSVSSSCMNKSWCSVFHTLEPGDSHVPQLLHARCLIVLFVYLAALFHFLCCWRWENTQQYSHDSALPLSRSFPLLSASPPPSSSSLRFLPHAFPWLSAPSFAFHLIKAFFEKETARWFTEPQQCQWAAMFFWVTLKIWLTPVQIQYEAQNGTWYCKI